MNKCLIVLVVSSLTFYAGSARRCYTCLNLGCDDPFSSDANGVTVETCPSTLPYCSKVQSADEGTVVARGCGINTIQPPSGRASGDHIAYYCATDLCNGSSRLAQTSIITVLCTLSLVFLISKISR